MKIKEVLQKYEEETTRETDRTTILSKFLQYIRKLG
jgi:hypothetical protein